MAARGIEGARMRESPRSLPMSLLLSAERARR